MDFNDFNIGLFGWQLLQIGLLAVVIFFLIKLGRRMLRYYNQK